MTIQIDTREKQRMIKNIIKTFDINAVKYISSKLYVGDYMNMDNPRRIIDRKHDLQELCLNVCQQHKRFTAELVRAREAGIHIIILCEHGKGIKCLDDVKLWENPRIQNSPFAVSGERLHKILSTMSKTYDFDIVFCERKDTGKKIMELLQ